MFYSEINNAGAIIRVYLFLFLWWDALEYRKSFLQKSFDNALDNHRLKLSTLKDSFYSFTEILMQYKLVEKANPLKKEEKKWYANPITTRKVGQKELAKEIQGGGGGNAGFATAGGKNLEGLVNAEKKALEL